MTLSKDDINTLTLAKFCDLNFVESEKTPEYIQDCDCGHHTGICKLCHGIITFQSEDKQYGHHNGKRENRIVCEHRPKGVNPERSKRINE